MASTARHPWGRPARVRPVAWLRDHVRVAGESLNFVSARLGTSFLVWVVVGIALGLPAGLWLLQVNMEAVSAQWEGRPGISIYFELTADQATIDAAVEQVRAEDAVADVQVTTADQALEEFQVYSGLGDALAVLDGNPLPASLRAYLDRDIDLAMLEALAERVQQLAGVEEVVVEKTWLERLHELSRIISRLGTVLAVLFGVGAILVTASSVRLAIESRLEELKVLKLVGATAGQIRRPFLYFGGIYGFGGGVIAAMLVAVTVGVIEPPLQSLLGSYERRLDLAGFDPLFLAVLLGLGSVLGVLGALLAVRQRVNDLEIF